MYLNNINDGEDSNIRIDSYESILQQPECFESTGFTRHSLNRKLQLNFLSFAKNTPCKLLSRTLFRFKFCINTMRP